MFLSDLIFENMKPWRTRTTDQLVQQIQRINKRRTMKMDIPAAKKDLLDVLRKNNLNKLFQNHVSFRIDYNIFIKSFLFELIEVCETLSDVAKYEFVSKTCDYVWISSELTKTKLNEKILEYLCRTKAKDINVIFTDQFPDWEEVPIVPDEVHDLPDFEDTDDEKQEEVEMCQPDLTEDDVLNRLHDIFNQVILNIPVRTLLESAHADAIVKDHEADQKFLLFNMEDGSYWSFSNEYMFVLFFEKHFFFQCIKMVTWYIIMKLTTIWMYNDGSNDISQKIKFIPKL